MHGLALVDFHNFVEPRENPTRIRLAADLIMDTVVATFADWQRGTRTIDVRLYGGWIDEHGSASPNAAVLLSLFPELRGRRNGMVLLPSLATRLVAMPQTLLRGTVRLHTQPPREKMVDQMIGCDAIILAQDLQPLIAVYSDDDDLVPPLILAHQSNPGRTYWVRKNSSHARPNDDELERLGLSITFRDKLNG